MHGPAHPSTTQPRGSLDPQPSPRSASAGSFASTNTRNAGSAAVTGGLLEAGELAGNLSDFLSDTIQGPLCEQPPGGRSPSPSKVVVAPGDSLWAIAERELGDGSLWSEIYNINKDTIGPNPSNIIPGTIISIPNLKNDKTTESNNEKSEVSPECQERGTKMSEINNLYEALEHFRSGAGGAVPAGPGLYSKIRASESYKKHVAGSDSTLANRIINRTLSMVPFDQPSGHINNSKGAKIGELNVMPLGSYEFDVSYSSPWNASEWGKDSRKVWSSLEVSLSTNELFDFKNEDYGLIDNLTREYAPGKIAGVGKDFYINVDMKEQYHLTHKQEK
jgi:LysM repeat protein